jgi:hypothetical protein
MIMERLWAYLQVVFDDLENTTNERSLKQLTTVILKIISFEVPQHTLQTSTVCRANSQEPSAKH